MRTAFFIMVAAFFLAPAGADADGPPDLAKISRRLRKEPAYTAEQPLYGLYVFGPQAQTHVWAVLDKSAAKNEQYDVLYFDLNADGDLTAENERIEGKIDERQRDVTFSIGDISDSNSGDTHKSLVLTRRQSKDGSVMLSLTWRGRETLRGGYAEEAGPYARFAASAAEAPILWFDASGQFSFQRWIWTKDLTIGGETDVPVFLGHQGVGRNTFCAVTQEFLPKDVPVLATLIYTDNGGRERRQLNHFLERC
ncbi:MAG TPA: hypothetical protein VG826_28190 [Pirellulales bacterium]|nr:hypothetical protein [Pirellulales bacterium]